MSKKYYTETVDIKGKEYWIAAIVLVFLLSMIGLYQKINTYESITGLSVITFAALVVGIIIFVISRIKLKTKVTSKSIDVKLSPFYRSKIKIPHSDVTSYRMEETDPFTIKTTKNFNSWFEKKLTLTGRNGVSITTTDGNTYFIGTTDPKALNKALQKAFKND